MFESFFPRPKLFFLSALAWFLVSLAIWYGFANDLASAFSLMPEAAPLAEGARPPFMNPEKMWLYQFIVIITVLFCIAWFFIERNRWYLWSVCGSAVILLVSYFQVQLSVLLNDWYGAFYDMIQLALSVQGTSSVTAEEYWYKLGTVVPILVAHISVLVLFSFFVKHYVFRWRTAMTEYYMTHWSKLRTVEGAAQRVQEDTMRFASIMEGLGAAFIKSIMTLIAFLPLLWELSKQITEIPFLGQVNGSLVLLALLSALCGTVMLAAVGFRLPGLEFNNQKVEAAYRKELVFGEDHEDRASPPTVTELYTEIRKNYYRLFFHYLYFNVFQYAYLQTSNFITLIFLGPTIIAGVITFGVFQQISNAFGQVENSFQFLVNSWTTIVELMSIHKRLKVFESRIDIKVTDLAEPELGV